MNDIPQTPQQQTLDSGQMITITMPLGAWATAMGIIAEKPWKDVAPLMQELQQQIQAAVKRLGG